MSYAEFNNAILSAYENVAADTLASGECVMCISFSPKTWSSAEPIHDDMAQRSVRSPDRVLSKNSFRLRVCEIIETPGKPVLFRTRTLVNY